LTSLSIDIGNTRIKAGVFESNTLERVFNFENMEGLMLFCENLDTNTPIIISSVTNDDLSSFQKDFKNLVILNSSTKLPVINNYKTPETLGNDRLSAVVGAVSLFPGENNLVIDAGTCIKYDFINSQAEYGGGSISPGTEIRFKALNHFTGKLPLVEKSKSFDLIGDSTTNAILSGVMFGTYLEMQGFINLYSEKNDNLKVIITGGDSAFFFDRLKGTIFAEPDLVLKGLFEILKYNAPNL